MFVMQPFLLMVVLADALIMFAPSYAPELVHLLRRMLRALTHALADAGCRRPASR